MPGEQVDNGQRLAADVGEQVFARPAYRFVDFA
jgi:hypothetical protein